MHRDGEHRAALVGEAPRRRSLDIEFRALDAHAPRGVIGNGLELVLGPAGGAMVERAAIAAVEAEAMDEAGFQVADEELLGGGVVSDGAEAGAGIVLAVMLMLASSETKPVAPSIFHTEPGVPPFAELARHPAGARLALDQAIAIGGDDLQAEQRSRGDIDVGRRVGVVAVQRHAESLADLAGRGLKLDRGVGDLALRRAAERGQVEHLKRGAVDIDEGEVERMEIGRHLANLPRAGERRDRRVAAGHDRAVLRPRAMRKGKDRSEAEQSGAEPSAPPGQRSCNRP